MSKLVVIGSSCAQGIAASDTVNTIDTIDRCLDRLCRKRACQTDAPTTEDSVWFVHERFEELRALLEAWGWLISGGGDLSEWDEGRREDPVMGVVRLRGVRDLGDLGRTSFTIKEWWAHPPVDGPIERQGFVLAGYHYTAVSLRRMVRHCFDPVRHPREEFHVHPDGDVELRAHGFITVEDALGALEQRLAEEIYDLAGQPLEEVDEDTIDEVFGEPDG